MPKAAKAEDAISEASYLSSKAEAVGYSGPQSPRLRVASSRSVAGKPSM